MKYTAAAGAIHDLAQVGDKDPSPCHLLCVSERTLYLLHNLAAEDITYRARYAIEFGQGVFRPVDRNDPEWQDYTDAVQGFQLEVMEMTCDIEAGLESIGAGLSDIADSMANLSGGCGAVTVNMPGADCISEIPNEDWEGSAELDPGEEGEGDPVPDDFETWEEYYAYKCDAAHYIWQILRNMFAATMGLGGLQLTSAIIVPAIAGAAGMLPAVLTPVGFVTFVGAIIVVGGLSILAITESYQMIEYLDDNKDDIVCALYESGTSADAVTALTTILEDAVQFIVWPAGLSGISAALDDAMGLAFSQLANNNVVEPLFRLMVEVTQAGNDCDGCDQPGGFCAGTYTFDDDIDDFEVYTLCTVSHDAAKGHDAVGSVKHLNNSGVDVEGWSKWPCTAGQEIDDGTGISLYGWLDGGTDAEFRMKVVATDSSYYDTAGTKTQDTWIKHETDLSTLNGKVLGAVYVIVDNGPGSSPATVWIDDMIIDP